MGQIVTVHAGADFNREEASGATSEIIGTFAEASIAATDALDVVVSLRHDDVSNFANETTGRVALSWRAADDLIVRAQAATGYKPPSLYQLTSAYGNPAFQPESSKSFELGIEKTSGRVRFHSRDRVQDRHRRPGVLGLLLGSMRQRFWLLRGAGLYLARGRTFWPNGFDRHC